MIVNEINEGIIIIIVIKNDILPVLGLNSGYTVSVLGREKGYTVKYTPLPEGVSEGEAQGNS